MGFTWSLYFAQEINEFEVRRFGNMTAADGISDKKGALQIRRSMGVRYYVYVDNVGVLGIERKQTADTVKQVCAGMDGIGLTMHEVELTNKSLEPL
eukprot:12415417-Karenia_brevis.AAC.1